MSEPARLHPADLAALADMVAIRLHELQQQPAATGLLDAKQIAQRLGVTPGWVYEHADELGARRLGAGSKPRLRFDLEQAQEALGGIRERPQPVRRRRREAAHRTTGSGVPLLPIGEDTRG